MEFEAYTDGTGMVHIFQLDRGRAVWSAGYTDMREAAGDYASILRGADPLADGWGRGQHDAALDAERLRGELQAGEAVLAADGSEGYDDAFTAAVKAAQRTHADFRMQREELGLSQADAADALGVTQRSVQRWEKPGGAKPPAFAWEWLDGMCELFADMLTAASQALDGAPDGTLVGATYYRSQGEYERHGRDGGYFGMANAVTREVCRVARGRGIECHAVFPEEADGAVALARDLTR